MYDNKADIKNKGTYNIGNNAIGFINKNKHLNSNFIGQITFVVYLFLFSFSTLMYISRIKKKKFKNKPSVVVYCFEEDEFYQYIYLQVIRRKRFYFSQNFNILFWHFAKFLQKIGQGQTKKKQQTAMNDHLFAIFNVIYKDMPFKYSNYITQVYV